jgi:hypothetical protein
MVASQRFGTGSSRFDGEWYFGTFMMGMTATAQTMIEHPELRDDNRDVLQLAAHTLVDPATRAFETKIWGEDAFTGSGDHCGYLCYWLFALNSARTLEPNLEGLEQGDRALARLETHFLERGYLETYPGEVYPVDMAMFMGALAMHGRATGAAHREALDKYENLVRTRWRDESGYLHQSITLEGKPRDRARGSGTALASFALGYAIPSLSKDLWDSLRTHGYRSVLGFGAIREYAHESGPGDIDSGPVIFGLGVSASGFAMGAARIHGDEKAFRALYASAHFSGAPVDGNDRRNFVIGGPIGQAILFAMVTAPKPHELSKGP